MRKELNRLIKLADLQDKDIKLEKNNCLREQKYNIYYNTCSKIAIIVRSYSKGDMNEDCAINYSLNHRDIIFKLIDID